MTARVVAATRGPKIVVYKYKAKKRYRRTQGARAEQSLLEVIAVSGPGSKRTARAAKADAEPKSAKAQSKTTKAALPKAKAAEEGAEPAPEGSE